MTGIFSYLWGALFVGIWIYMTIEFVRSAITGRFWFWSRKSNGKTWPPVRSESPFRFWMIWTFMAGPFVFISFFGMVGLFLE